MSVTNFVIPSASTILQNMLNQYKALAVANGYPDLSVDPNSEIYIRYSGLSQQLAIIYSIMQAQMDARMIDTASGDDLDRVLNSYGLARKPATSAEGFFELDSVAAQTLNAGMLLSGSNGLSYQVSVSGIYQPGQNVPVRAVDTGASTDLAVGSALTWVSPPPLAQATVLVSISLTGGSDTETDAEARARLIATVQNPAQSGNTQQLINMSSNVDPIVQGGFVYSNFNGAGTQLIALMGYQTDGYYIGRDIPHLQSDNTNLNNGSSPYNNLSQNYGNNLSNAASVIYGQMPAGVSNPYATYVTTVNNIPSDVTFALNLPYPVGSPVNGTGNGWLNFQGYVFPNPDGVYVQNYCAVTAVTSPVTFTLSAASRSHSTIVPIPGLTMISWIDRSGASNSGWRAVQAKIIAATDNNNDTWTITVDTPLVSGKADYYGNTQVSVGDFIMPASVNLQSYLDVTMGSYAALGCGQVTNALGLLQIGANRQPSVSANFSPYVSSQFLRNITSQNSEVFSANFIYNSTGGNLPPVSVPPSVFIPRQIAFYSI